MFLQPCLGAETGNGDRDKDSSKEEVEELYDKTEQQLLGKPRERKEKSNRQLRKMQGLLRLPG